VDLQRLLNRPERFVIVAELTRRRVVAAARLKVGQLALLEAQLQGDVIVVVVVVIVVSVVV